MEKRVYAALGHIRIDRITPLDIQGFVRALVDDGLSSENVKNHVRFVSVIMNYAVKKHILTFNPCVTVDYPTSQKKEREFYTVNEVRRFLHLLRNEGDDKKVFSVFFTLAAYMGARKGELLGLEWKDIDFNNAVISINRAHYYSGYHKTYFTDTPKTALSRRTLKLPACVMDTMKEYRQWQDKQREICGASWVETDRLFTTWNGETIPHSALYYFLSSFCERTGMRKVNIHSFRHFKRNRIDRQRC
jgi:integrase